MSKVSPAALLGLLGLLAGAAAAAQSAAPLDLSSFPRTELTISQGKPAQVHTFRVWIADTPPRAEQGLMFVSDLPESEGMVFPLEPPRVEIKNRDAGAAFGGKTQRL